MTVRRVLMSGKDAPPWSRIASLLCRSRKEPGSPLAENHGLGKRGHSTSLHADSVSLMVHSEQFNSGSLPSNRRGTHMEQPPTQRPQQPATPPGRQPYMPPRPYVPPSQPQPGGTQGYYTLPVPHGGIVGTTGWWERQTTTAKVVYTLLGLILVLFASCSACVVAAGALNGSTSSGGTGANLVQVPTATSASGSASAPGPTATVTPKPTATPVPKPK